MTEPLQRAIDGLFALCTDAPQLEYEHDGKTRQLEVVDGPPLAGTDAPRVLGVGTAAAYVIVAAQGQERRGYGGRSEVQIDVSNQLTAWSGDTSMTAARAAASDTLQGFRRLLRLHPDLDGAVSLARLVRQSYTPAQTAQGAAVQIDVVVRVNVTTFDDE